MQKKNPKEKKEGLSKGPFRLANLTEKFPVLDCEATNKKVPPQCGHWRIWSLSVQIGTFPQSNLVTFYGFFSLSNLVICSTNSVISPPPPLKISGLLAVGHSLVTVGIKFLGKIARKCVTFEQPLNSPGDAKKKGKRSGENGLKKRSLSLFSDGEGGRTDTQPVHLHLNALPRQIPLGGYSFFPRWKWREKTEGSREMLLPYHSCTVGKRTHDDYLLSAGGGCVVMTRARKPAIGEPAR